MSIRVTMNMNAELAANIARAVVYFPAGHNLQFEAEELPLLGRLRITSVGEENFYLTFVDAEGVHRPAFVKCDR